jgi:hypothetical protein
MDQLLETLNHPLGALTLVALVAGCATAAQRQYQTTLSSLTSEECRALEAVIEERERYGIIAPSRDADAAALQRCRLEELGGGSRGPVETLPHLPYAPTAPVAVGGPVAIETSQDEVRLERHAGVFAVPVVINRAISIPFVLDSGAADVQLPAMWSSH